MALIKCPECDGRISDKAISCPHCGYPMQYKPTVTKNTNRRRRRGNGMGSVVDRGKRLRKRYEVRVNCHLDDRGYPVYDVLGRYEERDKANLELALYNENPYDLKKAAMSFSDMYNLWFENKYINGKQQYSKSSMDSARAAYKKSKDLYKMKFADIKLQDLQKVIDQAENQNYSRSSIDNIKNLYTQIWAYAISKNIAVKNIASYIEISIQENDSTGNPFTVDEIQLLWNSLNVPYADIILIYIYSGWRVSELLNMKTSDINLTDGLFHGGIKTKAGKNRIVPIHSKIRPLVEKHMDQEYLVSYHDKKMNYQMYRKLFPEILTACGICPKNHMQKDTRHTFATLLNNAGANDVAIKRMMGHSMKKDVTKNVYTHKDIEQLRKNIELI